MSTSARTSRRARLVVAALTTVLAPIGVGAVTPAGAATVTTGVNIRPCVDLANQACAPVGTTSSSAVSKLRCWRDGSYATGNYRSNRWFLVYLGDGREGYVHSSFVSGQYSTPSCGTLAYVRAADRALSYVGQVYANGDLASRYSDWAPGPYAEWSGDCAKLTHASYAYGAGVWFARGNAIQQYNSYKSAGRVHSGLPRYGAPVYYDIAKPYGHTAIYVGGTTIVTTQGMDGARQPVVLKSLYGYSNYLGWAAVG